MYCRSYTTQLLYRAQIVIRAYVNADPNYSDSTRPSSDVCCMSSIPRLTHYKKQVYTSIKVTVPDSQEIIKH